MISWNNEQELYLWLYGTMNSGYIYGIVNNKRVTFMVSWTGIMGNIYDVMG
jgi:hypothetical protein